MWLCKLWRSKNRTSESRYAENFNIASLSKQKFFWCISGLSFFILLRCSMFFKLPWHRSPETIKRLPTYCLAGEFCCLYTVCCLLVSFCKCWVLRSKPIQLLYQTVTQLVRMLLIFHTVEGVEDGRLVIFNLRRKWKHCCPVCPDEPKKGQWQQMWYPLLSSYDGMHTGMAPACWENWSSFGSERATQSPSWW